MAGLFTLSACHAGRSIIWNTADIGDQKKFPAYKIENAAPLYRFIDAETEQLPEVPQNLDSNTKYEHFDDLLARNNTKAFIVIQNDSIKYERYFDDTDRSTIRTGFSIAKSFVSGLTGIAIAEGYIDNVDQPVTDFLTDFKHPGFENVTIKNLLNMRSGIKFSETYYNPFSHAARFYYGKNLRNCAYHLKINKTPGTEYHYNSATPLLIAMIIEKVTGRKFTDYFEEKIWKKLGMEYPATWNYDSDKHGMVKAFCCLNASALDFAKFGKLYLQHGEWNDEQIIPKEWVDHSMGIHNNSKDSEDYPYTYYWRVMDDGSVFAKGILGQYLFIDPARDLIIVRFGSKRGKIHWSELIQEVASQY